MIATSIKLSPAMKMLAENMDYLKSHEVAVGVLHGTGSYKTGISVVDLAMVHEFGSPTKNIPSRSFLRLPFTQNERKLLNIIDKSFTSLAKGKISPSHSYGIIGAEARNISIKSFSTSGGGQWEANSKSTVAKKGSSKPLIDTGRLRQSIQWEVRLAK